MAKPRHATPASHISDRRRNNVSTFNASAYNYLGKKPTQNCSHNKTNEKRKRLAGPNSICTQARGNQSPIITRDTTRPTSILHRGGVCRLLCLPLSRPRTTIAAKGSSPIATSAALQFRLLSQVRPSKGRAVFFRWCTSRSQAFCPKNREGRASPRAREECSRERRPLQSSPSARCGLFGLYNAL